MWPFSSEPAEPTPAAASGSCPVDHSKFNSTTTTTTNAPPSLTRITTTESDLSTERVTSSIPRWLPPSPSTSSSSPADSACPAHSVSENKEHWIYPSPSSFYTALQKKNRNPDKKDMNIVVPIHNAVNEKVWDKVLEWEKLAGEPKGEGVKLVSFVGKPKELSPRARWFSLIGYTPPFDRHDWIIDRPLPSSSSSSSSSPSSPSSSPPSQRIRYIIDFYTGRGALSSHPMLQSPGEGGMPNLAFYIDVRPALDSWEGVRMRVMRWWSSEGTSGKK